MITVPPIGQSVAGYGGEKMGAGVPRRSFCGTAVAGPLPAQSAVKARPRRWKKPLSFAGGGASEAEVVLVWGLAELETLPSASIA